MHDGIYKFAFTPAVALDEVEETLQLALIAAEALHGRAQVRLETGYRFDRTERCCVVNATLAAGRDVCRIFTGFLGHEFGETAFTVRRVDAKPEPAGVEGSR